MRPALVTMATIGSSALTSALLVLGGVMLGSYLQASLLDDVILVRLEHQRDVAGHPLCAAQSLSGYGRELGAWPQGADGACHMSSFIKYRTLSLLKGGM
jgi:hypothetical protein